MNHMKKQSILIAAVSILLLSSCQKSADEVSPSSSAVSAELSNTEGSSKCKGGPKPQGPPPPEKIMADLDLDKDGFISTREAKGPLVNDFDKIDTNTDDLISLEELKAGSPPPPGK
jgi:hypothetical protein